MEKNNRMICLIGLVLMMTTCMAGSGMDQFSNHESENLQDPYCLTATIRNHACHAERCHEGITYVKGCDSYTSDLCDNFTATYDAYNSSQWHNTTCDLYICAWDISDDCGNANLTYVSCTNGDCRNGIAHFHACYTNGINLFGDKNSLGDIFDIPCLNLFFYTARGSRYHIIR
jgi:hypothetical protein